MIFFQNRDMTYTVVASSRVEAIDTTMIVAIRESDGAARGETAREDKRVLYSLTTAPR